MDACNVPGRPAGRLVALPRAEIFIWGIFFKTFWIMLRDQNRANTIYIAAAAVAPSMPKPIQQQQQQLDMRYSSPANAFASTGHAVILAGVGQSSLAGQPS